MQGPLIGVLALQGAFAEHQKCLEAIGCRTRQVRTVADLEGLQAIVLPGGESTAMGLIGTTHTADKDGKTSLWDALRNFCQTKPTWGTCAGMILLAEKCIGTSAVIQQGQALIGGVDITVCRNYFGSQISSFEMATPPPPSSSSSSLSTESTTTNPFPGVFIRAPAILAAGAGVEVLGRVHATPCRQAAVTLEELERKLLVLQQQQQQQQQQQAGGGGDQPVVVVVANDNSDNNHNNDTNDTNNDNNDDDNNDVVRLPGAAPGGTARHVICAVRKNHLLCTAFHPELTDDYRWHEYFVNEMVKKAT